MTQSKKNKKVKSNKNKKNNVFIERLEEIIEGEELAKDEYPLRCDGFDDAIIGISQRMNTSVPLLVYSKNKMIEILMCEDKMEFLEALEYLDFNVFNAWVGNGTPIYVDDII